MGDFEPMNSVPSLIERMIEEMQEFNPTYWPYTLKVNMFDRFTAERFCYDNFKSKNWRNIGNKFAFKHKEDYEWFVLRWS